MTRRRAVAAVVVAALAGCSGGEIATDREPLPGASTAEPSSPQVDATTTTVPPIPEQFALFTSATVEITDADGRTWTPCLLVADTEEERSRGLMEVTDLDRFDGMVFVYDEPREAAFYMFNTRLPLSIAFFGPAGELVSTADMEPCPETDPGLCPLTPSGGIMQRAVEVEQGDLATVGVGPGSVLGPLGAAC
jgi:uncharacterized membrane protein (UPF0127 family)